MTDTPDQLDLEGLESAAKAATPGPWTFLRGNVLDAQIYRVASISIARRGSEEFEANGAFIAAWNPATAISILSRLRASEAECEQLRLAICGGEDAPGHAMSLPLQTVLDIQRDNFAVSRSALERLWSAEALATSQAETIRGLTEALSDVRKLIAEGAMSGFNPLDGNWADRLFISQRRTTAALSRTPSDEARPDTGADGGEGV